MELAAGPPAVPVLPAARPLRAEPARPPPARPVRRRAVHGLRRPRPRRSSPRRSPSRSTARSTTEPVEPTARLGRPRSSPRSSDDRAGHVSAAGRRAAAARCRPSPSRSSRRQSPASSSASVSCDQPGGIERHRDGPVEVGPEPDVLDTGDVDGVADRAGDGRRVVAAAGRRPEADADDAAGLGDAHGPARRSGCGRCRRRPRTPVCEATTGRWPSRGRRRSSRPRHGRRRRASPRASIRADHLAPGRGQPALRDAVGRAAERVVEEVARRHHPEARVGDDLDVGRVVVERVGALDRQQAGRDRRGSGRVARPRMRRGPPATG